MIKRIKKNNHDSNDVVIEYLYSMNSVKYCRWLIWDSSGSLDAENPFRFMRVKFA